LHSQTHTMEKSKRKIESMSNKHRVDIVKESRARIKAEVKGYDDLLCGEKEVVLDEYISIISVEKGYSLSEFYGANGLTINKILSE
jgi:hypothetical protein